MTVKIYHDDQYAQRFSAAVLEHTSLKNKVGVILDRTAFYPTSGGQPHDVGTLNGLPVRNVIETEAHQLIHILDSPLDDDTVDGEIDWKRRFDHMQQHTGQHILSQACIQVCNGETVSFHLGEEDATIDIADVELHDGLAQQIETLANRIVFENRAVTAHQVGPKELHRFPVRKLPSVHENIRIIEVKDFDFSPCGGTHCQYTGEIGLIKIKKFERYKGGTRLHFACGGRALQDYQQKTAVLKALTELLSTGEPELPQNVEKIQEEIKSLRRTCNHLSKEMLEYEAQALVTNCELHGDVSILRKKFVDRDPKALKLLAHAVLEQTRNTVVLFAAENQGKAALLFSRSDDVEYSMNSLMKTACALIDGRGGGQSHQAQGGGANPDKLDEALQSAVQEVLTQQQVD